MLIIIIVYLILYLVGVMAYLLGLYGDELLRFKD